MSHGSDASDAQTLKNIGKAIGALVALAIGLMVLAIGIGNAIG